MLYNIYIMVLACNCPSYPPRMTQGRAEHRRRTPFHWHCDSTHAPLRLRDAGRRSSRGGRKKCFHGHRLGVQSFPLMKWDINEIKWNIYNGMIWNWYQWDMVMVQSHPLKSSTPPLYGPKYVWIPLPNHEFCAWAVTIIRRVGLLGVYGINTNSLWAGKQQLK